MKQEIEQLIDRLASKELTFGCRVNYEGYAYVREKMEDYITVIRVRGDGAFQAIEQDGSPILESVTSCGRTYDEVAWQKLKKESEILGHPILIGDVLEKMKELERKKDRQNSEMSGYTCFGSMSGERQRLVTLWGIADFTKSLQSIFEEAVWEEVCAAVKDCQPVPHRIDEPVCEKCGGTNIVKITTAEIKQPHIRELFQFLLTLGL